MNLTKPLPADHDPKKAAAAVDAMFRTMSDNTRAFSELDRMNASRRIDDAERLMRVMTRGVSRQEQEALGAAQARADSVLRLFGEDAPPPLQGETLFSYRKRLMERVAANSPKFKNERNLRYLDAPSTDLMEGMVLADAQAHGREKIEATPGALVPIEERDPTGRVITRYIGDIGAAFGPFMQQGVSGKINLNPPPK